MARMRRSVEMASMQNSFDSKQFHSTARQQGTEAVVSEKVRHIAHARSENRNISSIKHTLNKTHEKQ